MAGVTRTIKSLNHLGKASLSLILFFTIVIVGCTQPSLKPTMLTISPIGNPTPSQKVASTATVAPTLARSTAYSTIPATSTTMIAEMKTPPENILKQDCFQLLPNVPEKNEPTGTVVLSRFAYNPSSSLLDFTTRTRKKWDKGLHSVYFTSPNGQWLAYYQNVEPGKGPFEVIVESAADIAKGTEKKRIIWKDPAWITIYGWLSNDILLLIKKRDPLVSTVALNPFTGKQEEFIPNYPDQPDFTLTNPTFQFYGTNVLPDPTLRSVAYQQFKVKSGGQALVIWDLQMKQTRTEMTLAKPLYHDPLWSADGENFVIPITTRFFTGSPQGLHPSVEDWFAFHQDGQVVQVTHFGDFFSNPQIGRASRSPNNRFVAFWLTVNFQPVQEHLAILDVETQTVIDTCIPGSLRGDTTSVPIWSPDGNYIAVLNEYKENFGHVLVANLSDKWAVNVAEDGIPKGWLVGDKAH